ncbi:DUF4190 domain-containing protein [Nocardia anaemiae]|uniref:DUF4190 domain-containing protein n=1 Tax=Nocardia anaemiae TaxID=263910 RepID=UPI0007A44AD2|nr:DUF4190 domain-containing protein [Nocardia anaemiae]
MSTPQQGSERGDASPEKPVGESEPVESSDTDTPAASGPWESEPVEPAAQTPPQRAAAETAPDLVVQPSPPESEQQEPWNDTAAARYDQDRPGTVYPPITDATPQTPEGGYPAYPERPDMTPEPRSGSQTLSIIGFVCAGISLLFCPYLFGPVGIVLGIIGHKKGESLGKWAAIASAISLVIGLILVYAVFSGSMIPDSE